MTDNFIQLNDSNVLRLDIKTASGEKTGEFLEFESDLPDYFKMFLKSLKSIDE